MNVTLTIFSCVMFLVVLHTHTHLCVSLLQGSRRDQEEGGGAGPSPQKKSRAGRWSWSWAAKVGLLSLQVVPQQQCNGHCPCDSAQARQLKEQLRSALVAGQWRSLFWRRSTVSAVFFGWYPRSSLHSFVPSPLSPSLISHLASVDVKQNGPHPRV